jgi:hypothetical protein
MAHRNQGVVSALFFWSALFVQAYNANPLPLQLQHMHTGAEASSIP